VSVLPGTPFSSDLDHYADGAAGLLEFRLVDGDGNEQIAWSASAITQVTASGDGPLWRYRASRLAPAVTGVYTGQWRLAAVPGEVWDDESPIVVSVFAVDIPMWAPLPSHVAAILRARTRGIASRDAQVAGEQDAFTSLTRPTYNQVTELIGLAVGDLSGLMAGRTPCTDELTLAAGSAAAYRAAMLVEISYFPEQTNSDQTAFKALSKLWDDASKSVAKAVVARCPLTPGGSDLSGMPIGRVPVRCPTTWQEVY
jgi:hypothetical protein